MCGIFGIYSKDGSISITETLVKSATQTLNHRGPDDEGYFIGSKVGLGHRRLSIIDISGGHQPIFNKNKDKCIIFNGEIYNYQIIRKELENKGYPFFTNSDTEVILAAYEVYGRDCIKMLRGIFAFAIYDIQTNELVVARDHLGVKPLYYYENSHVFIFASEVKAIFKTGYIRPEVEESMIDSYLTVGYTPTPYTLFKNIKKLRPAHYIFQDSAKSEIQEYWNIENTEKTESDYSYCKNQLHDLLMESVEMQLVGEVPLGVFLSGGLDSSTIVACMHALGHNDIRTFSVGFTSEYKEDCELEYARLVAKTFNTNHKEYILTHMDFFESIDTIMEYTEEPLVDRSAIALYQLAKLSKKDATILLSGEGGDEMFAGYPIYNTTKKIEKLRLLLRWLPRNYQKKLARILPANEKQQKYIDWICTDFNERYQSISADVTDNIRTQMYTKQFLSSVNESQVLNNIGQELISKIQHQSTLSRMLYFDMKTWLIDDLMLKADKMTMANAIELRVPFLDFKVAEFATSLPDSFKLKGAQGKYILKKVMESYLPHEIIWRPKKGFTMPTTQWFRHGLYQKIKDLLLSDSFLGRNYVAKDYIENILQRHRSGKSDFQSRLFSLITLELWHRKYID